MHKRANPKSYRPDDDDTVLIRELLDFYGVTSESQLIKMAWRALNRERIALTDLYMRPATASAQTLESGKKKHT